MTSTPAVWSKYLPSRAMVLMFVIGGVIASLGEYILEANPVGDWTPFFKFPLRFLVEIGDIIGAVAFLSYMAERFQQIPLFERIVEAVSQKFEEIAFKDMKYARHYGLSRLYNRFGLYELLDEIDKSIGEFDATEEIYLLCTYIFVRGKSDTFDKIFALAQKGVRFHILAMAQDSPMLKLRAEEVSGKYGDEAQYREEMRWFWREIEAVRGKLGDKEKGLFLTYEFYDLLGCPICLRVSNGEVVSAYSSIYLNKPTSEDFVWLKWSGGEMTDYLYEYVRAKERKAVPRG